MRSVSMGTGCMTASKYFLFLLNLIFFLLGGVILGFGLWLLLDNQSFIVIINNSTDVKVACYVLISVGAFSMLLGLFGCLGAIFQIKCLLGLYFTCLLVILVAQIAAGVLVYLQKEKVNEQMSKIVDKVLGSYAGNSSRTEQAWDLIQKKMQCCGWMGQEDWNNNAVILNSSQLLFPCSCQNLTLTVQNRSDSGFCEAQTPDWPVYNVGCSASVENWLITNIGVVLGICLTVALIELLGMILSICLCRNVGTDYSKVPRF
ncbi:CD82 antigen isoform X1 [Oryzias latipes]